MIIFANVRLSNKDWLDQPAHFAGGAGSVLVASVLTANNVWAILLAGILSFVYACRREYKQHPDTGNFIDLDSIVWLVGVVFGCVVCLI